MQDSLPLIDIVLVAAGFTIGALVGALLVAWRSSQAQAQRGADLAALEARFAQFREGVETRDIFAAQFSTQGREALRNEFSVLATRLMAEQEQTSQAGLGQILNPLREQLQEFRRRVDEVHSTEVRDRSSLLTEVRNLQVSSERVNQETANLARALKGDKKLQGNWGELVLSRILEQSGLRVDAEYFLQSTFRNDAGDMKRPDVIVHLPEDRQIVIDAKLSLNAYEAAVNSEDDQERDRHVRTHVSSLRAHVKKLAEQDYASLPGLVAPDFVLMFVPVESAFVLALQSDANLVTDAYNDHVVIVSPTTLLMSLRIIHNLWRTERQNRNAEDISRRAGVLYDKLRLFAEDLLAVGRDLEQARSSHDRAVRRLSEGKGNVIRQAEMLRELGARVSQPLPESLVVRSLEETGDEDSDTIGATSANFGSVLVSSTEAARQSGPGSQNGVP
jgi:DNA recombination protein RmuC